MINRQSKRIIAGYKAEFNYSDTCYSCLIENISETGVNILTDPTMNAVDFPPGETISLKIEMPAGEPLHLTCIVKWCKRIHPRTLRNQVGLEIIDPPWDKNIYFL